MQKDYLFESAFLHSSIGMALVSPKGKLLDANPSLCRILGYERDEILRFDFQTITHGEDLDKDLELFNSCLKGERGAYNIEKRYFHKNGDIIWAKLTVSAIRKNGKAELFVSQIQDITKHKMAQQKLIDASKLAALGEMAAGIAHEINNPLTVIEGNASILKARWSGHSNLDADSMGRLDKINKTVQRISRIIHGMKDFARRSQSKTLGNHCASQILQETLNLCHQKLSSSKIEIITDFPECDMEVHCDPVELGQVYLNILSNAIQAMEASDQKQLRLSIRQQDRGVVVDFQDSGPGIPRERRSKVMKPFFTTKPKGQGTGLGLSLSKEMLSRMNGDIQLVDAPKGCLVRVILDSAQKSSRKNTAAA